MSKSKKEMDEELKRIREQEEANKAAEYRRQIEEGRSQSRAQSADELIKGRSETDPANPNREYNKWEEAMRLADAAHGGSVRAYDDWRAAMFELMSMFSMLNKALTQSMKETITSPLLNAVEDYVALPLYDKISSAVQGKPELILPALQHEVHVNDQGKLEISPLTRSDKGKEMGDLDKYFEAGVRVWLSDQGYNPKPNGDKYEFFDANGVALTKDKFEQIKKDPDTGLGHFLEEGSDLEFKPRGP